MSHVCPYCQTELSTKRYLDRHQKTVKYCLELQRAQGVKTNEETFSCDCGEVFHRKYHLTRHQATCSHSTVTVNNTIGTQNIQNNFNINVFGSTASSLTPELIAQKVMEVISLEAVEKGLVHMTEEVARPVFSNEKGNWLVRVADGSRNKLVLRTDEGEQSDPQGHRTTRLLKAPFMKASLLALEQTDRPKDVENTIEDIKDEDTYDKKTMGALLRIAPAKFNEINDVFTEAHLIAEERIFAEAERVMAKREKEKAKLLKLETAKWRENFLDHSQDLHDGTFWHPIHRFVIQPDTEREFSILGKREKRGDQTISLTKVDLSKVAEMGLSRYLAPEYVARLKEVAA